MLRRMNMRLAALGLALLLTTACESEEPSAAPDLTVHPVLAGVERGTDLVTKSVEPSKESVVEADGKLVRIGPAVLAASEYATAEVVSGRASGVEAASVRLTQSGRTVYSQVTAEAACHPVGDPRRLLVYVHAGSVVAASMLDPSVKCDVGITHGRLTISPETGASASLIAHGE